MSSLWRTVVALAISTAMCPAILQAADKTSSPDEYAVEIIIFQHQDQSRNTAEAPSVSMGPVIPPPETNAPRGPELDFLLLPPRSVGPAEDLPRQGLQLDRVLRRLQQLDAYQPLAHLGWQQVPSTRVDADSYWLNDRLPASSGLSGSLKIYKERFLHLALDLEYLPSDGSVAPFRIIESRRLRDEELQYFDNPRFGVIASVRRLEDPETEALQEPQAAR